MAADGRTEFDPKEIAHAAFPTAFRGYDQEAVRQYLTRLAAAVGRAQELGILGSVDPDDNAAYIRAAEAEREAAELQRRVDELEEMLQSAPFDSDAVEDDVPDDDESDGLVDEALVDEADGLVDDVDDGDLVDPDEQADETAVDAAVVEPERSDAIDRPLDESELIEQLGHETAKILEAARSAAADIVKRSEDESAIIKNEAAVAAHAVRDEAQEAMRKAKEKAAKVAADAEAEVAKLATDAQAAAEQRGVEAEDEAEEILATASAKAEGDLAAARQRAGQIVADAEQLREEILSDFVRRRRVHHEQLERLTAARDRLALALATAHHELDDVSSDIERAAPEHAIRQQVDIDLTEMEALSEPQEGNEVAAIIAQLHGARVEVAPSPRPATTLTDGRATGNGSGSTGPVALKPDDDTLTLARVGRMRSRSEPAADVTAESDPGVIVIDEPIVESDPVVDDDGLAPSPGGAFSGSEPDLVFELDSSDSSFADDTGELAAGPPSVFNRGYVDSGYDNDEGGHVVEQARSTGGDGSDTDGDYPPAGALAFDGSVEGDQLLDQLGFAADPVLGTESGALGRSATRGDLPRNTHFAGRLPFAFEQRDVALTRSTAGFRRRLKRAVNDDQSDVLDRLRAGKREIESGELPSLDEQLTGYVEALTPALHDVVIAGGSLLGSSDVPLAALDNLCLQLAKHIVDNLRLPTIDTIEAALDDDREAILDPVRAIYRDFRNELLPDLIEDALHEAYALGLFHAIEEDELIVWVIDPRLDPDPTCEENSASPALVKGSEFPSGHVRPLSMPGCRCLAVPAS